MEERVFLFISIIINAVFFYSLLRSNFNTERLKNILLISFGAIFLQWGTTYFVLAGSSGISVRDFSNPLTFLFIIFSFIIFSVIFRKLGSLSDPANKSIHFFKYSIYGSSFAVALQSIFYFINHDSFGAVNWLEFFTGYIFVIITLFLVLRILQQVRIDVIENNRPLSKIRIAGLSFLMSHAIVGCVLTVTESFLSIINSDKYVLELISLTALIAVSVIYGERQYDQKNETLNHLAYHDAITKLKNRAFFDKKMRQLIKAKKPFYVMTIDLDHFKDINDVHGHSFGDALLKVIGNRLQDAGKCHFVARVGGDEFAILIAPSPRITLESFCNELSEAISERVTIENYTFTVTASIGISLYPKDGESVEEVLKKADIALYKSKEKGRNTFSFFDNRMEEEFQSKIQLKEDLTQAIKRKEFFLHYQPLVDLASKRIYGFEALVRWNHPVKGTIPPDRFIPAAEETGLIQDIGAWVMEEACSQIVRWNDVYQANWRISVNLSLKQFNDQSILNTICTTLNKTKINPELMILEITETALMQDADFTLRILQQLQECGIKVSIDDFGTGYSSLSYLKNFNVNTIKIDKSFIQDLSGEGDNQIIVNAILSLARNLGVDVVAEGIENQKQLNYLKNNLCQYGQGYYLGKPYPTDEILEFIEANQHQLEFV